MIIIVVGGEVPGDGSFLILSFDYSPAELIDSFALTTVLSEFNDDVSLLGVEGLTLLRLLGV